MKNLIALALLTALTTVASVQVPITWDPNPDYDLVLGYNVYTAPIGGTNWTKVATVQTNRYTVVLTNSAQVAVTAYNAAVEGLKSDVLTLPGSAPEAVKGLKAAAIIIIP